MAKYGSFKYGEMPYGDVTLWIYHRNQQCIDNDTDLAYINYWDLNRIEKRTQQLEDRLNSYAYMPHIKTKTNWSKQTDVTDFTNIPTLSHIKRIHDNIQILIDSFFVYPHTPTLPDSFENLTIHKINDIEKILHDLHYMINGMEDTFAMCGSIECGE